LKAPPTAPATPPSLVSPPCSPVEAVLAAFSSARALARPGLRPSFSPSATISCAVSAIAMSVVPYVAQLGSHAGDLLLVVEFLGPTSRSADVGLVNEAHESVCFSPGQMLEAVEAVETVCEDDADSVCVPAFVRRLREDEPPVRPLPESLASFAAKGAIAASLKRRLASSAISKPPEVQGNSVSSSLRLHGLVKFQPFGPHTNKARRSRTSSSSSSVAFAIADVTARPALRSSCGGNVTTSPSGCGASGQVQSRTRNDSDMDGLLYRVRAVAKIEVCSVRLRSAYHRVLSVFTVFQYMA